jgi:sugar phosphate isomerase/epimerase
MRLGVGSYTFVWAVGVPGYPAPPQPMTAEPLLAKAAELGVSVVQIADNLPLDRLTEGELASLRACADRLGIDLEVGTCGIARDHLLRYLDLARRLRSRVLRLVLDTEDHHPEPAEALAALRAVLPDFERAGIALAIENHDRFPAATLAALVADLGAESAGICLDTANSLGCLETVEAVLATLGPRVINVHVKDFRIERLAHKKGFVIEGCPAGRGQLDIPGLLAALRTLGRDPSIILELWPPPEPDVAAAVAKEAAWAAESVHYLRRFLAE